MEPTEKSLLETLAEDDDTVGMLQELLRMIESGEAVKGALKFRLNDGTEEEFVFGAESEHEREVLLAKVQAYLATKH